MCSKKSRQVYVVSGYSGVGKNSLIKMALEDVGESVELAKSCTTRYPRADDEKYIFLSIKQFEDMRQKEEFIEVNTYSGNHYGTSKRELERILETGKNVILEIDTNGYKQVLSSGLFEKENIHSIFIVTEAEELLNRLKKRNTEDMQKIMARIKNAIGETTDIGLYDFVLENNDFEQALNQLKMFLSGKELKMSDSFDAKKFLIEANEIVRKYTLA